MLKRIILFIGPVFFMFLLSLANFKKIKSDKKILFLFIILVLYYLLFSLKADLIEDNYVLLLVTPMVAISLALLEDYKYFRIF